MVVSAWCAQHGVLSMVVSAWCSQHGEPSMVVSAWWAQYGGLGTVGLAWWFLHLLLDYVFPSWVECVHIVQNINLVLMGSQSRFVVCQVPFSYLLRGHAREGIKLHNGTIVLCFVLPQLHCEGQHDHEFVGLPVSVVYPTTDIETVQLSQFYSTFCNCVYR